MRKAKILFRDILDTVIDDDPTGGLPGSAASMAAAAAKSRYPMVYKCKKCRRTLATAFNLLPHVQDESPVWTASKWSLPAEDVLEAASEAGLQLCSASLFINPVKWMEPEIKQNLTGRLYCPNCQARVGQYSWVRGENCGGCEAKVNPAFSLDVTEIIFRTKNRFLQSSQREPVVVWAALLDVQHSGLFSKSPNLLFSENKNAIWLDLDLFEGHFNRSISIEYFTNYKKCQKVESNFGFYPRMQMHAYFWNKRTTTTSII